MITFALAKGRVSEQAIKVLEELGYHFNDYSKKSRKLIFTDETESVSFFLVKSPDVATYVEKGVADLGIVGKDMLLEFPADVYELLNLNFGKCKMCIAAYPDLDIHYNKTLIVATKYSNIAKNYFNKIDQPTELISLGGSVELAPVLGLADCIVDIVETGNTLKENGLVVLKEILDISSRLIVNKISLKMKDKELKPILEKFQEIYADN